MSDLTINKALEIIKLKNPNRFRHVYGTYEMAKILANHYQVNPYKTMVAAILHDYAKNEPYDKMKKIIIQHFTIELLKYPAVIHGFVGSYLLQEELYIHDEDIIQAVKYHVTGHPDMNEIAKIVYIADFTEKNRVHEGVEFCRQLSKMSLDLGVLAISEKTLNYLKQKNNVNIHPLTIKTYEKFLEKVGASVYDTIKNDYQGV